MFPFFLRIFSMAIATVAFGSGVGYGIHAYSLSFSTLPAIDAPSPLGLSDSIVISFTDSLTTQDYRENIRIEPTLALYAKWESDYTRLILTPKENWKPETTYTISLPLGKTKKFTFVDPLEFSVQTVPYPTILSITPEDNQNNVRIDIEDPIRIRFAQSIKDFNINISLIPDVSLIKNISDNENIVEALPQQPLLDGQQYTLSITAQPKNTPGTESHILYSGNFTTTSPPPTDWSKDLGERLQQAKQFTRPKIQTGKYIDINLSSQVMSVFENGDLLNAFLISSGKRGMDTPEGTYQIHNKAPRPWSKKYSLFMPYWMALTSDGKYGIHELPEWPGGYKEGANHLGIPVSHGCVRLGIGPAQMVYNWTDIGTAVVVHK